MGRKIFAVLTAVFLLVALSVPAMTLDDDEYNGYAAVRELAAWLEE